jgi:predicted unusual protein kinase regulating ubiquinone biosynthesis (AarF/ABC1/UbiB family)
MKDDADDENTLGNRLKRYAHVSTALGGLAARLAGTKYLGRKADSTSEAADIKAVLGSLKGPLMKVAQLLATIPDAIPPEYAAEFSQLQSHAPPMGWPFVKRRMTAELGPHWPTLFQSFSQQATAAASLGQVHEAVTLEGTRVACKLQYPSMDAIIDADIHQLKLAAQVYEIFNKAILTEDLQAEISDRLKEELDYLLEATHIRMYTHMLSPLPHVHLPQVIPELTTPRLLTMTWLEGKPLLQSLEAPQEKRNELGKSLFQAWYMPFYHYGIIHGDPHLGNYTITPDYEINLLDFGCVRKFPPSFVQGVIDLYRAIQTEDEALAVHAYEQWGFLSISKELVQVLNLWAKFLYRPLLEDRVQRMDETNNSAYGREVAEKVHTELKRLGGIRPPRPFLFMDRAAVGVGSAMMHLKAELNWHEIFNHLIEGFNLSDLEQRQQKLLSLF